MDHGPTVKRVRMRGAVLVMVLSGCGPPSRESEADGGIDAWAFGAARDADRAVTDAPSPDASPEDVSASQPDADAGPGAPGEEATLASFDGEGGDRFGFVVSLSADGSRALVGSPYDDTTADRTGSVRVFVRSGTRWTEEATLVASDGAYGDSFGWSVALSADGARALVGAPLDDTPGGVDAGTAHIFVRVGTSWTEEANLLAPDGDSDDRFGYSVSISADGTGALVGTPSDDTLGGVDAGSSHVFARVGTNWTQEANLLAPDGARDDLFGESVCLSADGSRALVGAIGDDGVARNAGSGRVFVRVGTSWVSEATLVAFDGADDERLGLAVSMSADGARALVAAPHDTRGGVSTGSVYVFARSVATWTAEGPLLALDGRPHDRLGSSVSLSADGSRALVGVPGDSTPIGEHAGTARVFVDSGTGWTDVATLFAADGAANDAFGTSVSLSADGSRGLVGVPRVFTGTARVFRLE